MDHLLFIAKDDSFKRTNLSDVDRAFLNSFFSPVRFESKFKNKNQEFKNDLNFHLLLSTSSAKTLDQSADRLFFTTKKSFNKMESTINQQNTRFEFSQNQGDRYQQLNYESECKKKKLKNENNKLNCIKQPIEQQIKASLTNQQLANNQLLPVSSTSSSKLVPVYQLLKQQVCFNFKFNNLIKLRRRCDLRFKSNASGNSLINSFYHQFLLLLMLFCLVSPLNAMSTLLSGSKSKNQTTTVNQNFDQINHDKLKVNSSSTSPTFTSFSNSISNSKNRTNRAIVTTSPKRLDKPILLTSNKLNHFQLNDSIHHLTNYQATQTQSLPYNYNFNSNNHQRIVTKKSNESNSSNSGIFFTNRSSNYSLPILSQVANTTITTNNHHHQSRIVITRNQPKIERQQQQNFKQLNVSTILSDLNAQASQSSNSINSSVNNLVAVKNSQINDINNQKNEKFTSSLLANNNENTNRQDIKMESSRRSSQIDANLPETFYQQTKKRMTANSSNGLALAQTRNPVLSSILKDIRPPSVSYSSSSSSSVSTINSNPKNNKKQITRIMSNAYASLPAPVSTFSTTNTIQATPLKRPPLASSSTNKETIITKELTTNSSKDKERISNSPDSLYVVHHHHLVSEQAQQQPALTNANERQQQAANKQYTLLSSTESSKSKNYYKNEEEDDRVSTASIFFDDEPANSFDKSSNSLDLSMLLKKEFDEQSNNKIIPNREQLNNQYGSSNLNLFALLPTATVASTITPIASMPANHDRPINNNMNMMINNNKDPTVFSTTVRSIKVDLNRNQNTGNNNISRPRPGTIEKLPSSIKVFGQRESVNDIWKTTNGHARVPISTTTNNNKKDVANNLTNMSVVDMKQFQLNLAKTAVRENPKERFKNENTNNNLLLKDKNTISTLTTTTTQSTMLIGNGGSSTSTRFNQNQNNNKNLFKYVNNKNPLNDDNKVMDNAVNSLDNNNLPGINGLDALDSNQIYNRTMLMNDLKEFKDRHLKKSTATHANETNSSTNHAEDVLIKPVNEENDELLNNALGSADSPSNRESYRLTTERLAYILIGSCVAISLFCLLIVTFSIRCRDMCDEYKNWKNAEKLALFNYRYQQHQQQQQRNHRLKLHQMAAFNLVSESNSSSSQLISNGHSGSNNTAAVNAVGALTNLSRPIFGPSCCCCPNGGGSNLNNNDKKHSQNNQQNQQNQNNNQQNQNKHANNNSNEQQQANFHFHPCPRGRLPFGAASSVFARFNGNATAANANAVLAAGQLNENNENSLELLDEENDTLNGSLTDEFTTTKLKTPHQNHVRSTQNASQSNGVCLQCTCEDSFEDEESDLGSLTQQMPTAIKNGQQATQQYLRPNQLINHTTHAKYHHNVNNNNNNNNHHHHINHHLNHHNNQNNKQTKRGVFQPMDNNWIQSSMIIDELHRKHNHHRLVSANNPAKYEFILNSSIETFCSIFSKPLIFWSSNSETLI